MAPPSRRTDSQRTDSPRKEPRRRAVVPTETALVWGLLRDLLLLPLWLWGLLTGHRRARLKDGLRPFQRVSEFVGTSWMSTLLIASLLSVFTVEVILRRSGWSEAQLLQVFALRREDLVAGHYSGLFLHVFSHAGAAHLFGNLLALLAFGRVVERHLGPWRLFGAFCAAAITSTGLSLLFQALAPGHPSVPTLGASGAVAGLIALGVLLEPFAITFEALLPMPLFLVGWLSMAADLAALWQSGAALDAVDHPAHLGGYLSVSLYYFALDKRQKKRARIGLLLNFVAAFTAFTLWRVLNLK